MASNDQKDSRKDTLPRRLKLNKPVLSLQDHATTSRTPKSSEIKHQTSVFARLQAHLWPHGISPSPSTAPIAAVANDTQRPEPPFLKVRIVTWNMNESLPKGDLGPLLGMIPPYEADPNSALDLRIPGLNLDPDHPCHIVAVAGQECPTLMGLPLGLGGGLKWDKDDDEKKKEKMEDKRKDKEIKPDEKKKKEDTDPLILNGARTPSKYQKHEHHTTGWSAILEDYLSRGIGSIQGARPDIKTPQTNQSLSSLLTSPDRLQQTTTVTTDNNEIKWNVPAKTGEVSKVGPYELLAKERMMGIYLALYVHRDVRPLVEGHSQSSVAAGLMGGRLGNKGAVAISLKISGTSFLFLSAHLAAHEGKAALRIANMTKIKAELAVNDFLSADDERKRAEDPTDRFDHTFLCGDLNFRLDITRLHAEWLINRRQYAQAQEFDQLRKIMKGLGTHAFSGFSEAAIDFPPTFKYDVLRTLKNSKREKEKNALRKQLSELEEKEYENAEQTPQTATGHENGSPIGADAAGAESDSDSASSDGSSTSSDNAEESLKEKDLDLDRKRSKVVNGVKKRWHGLFHSTASLPNTASPTAQTPTKRKEPPSASKLSVSTTQTLGSMGQGFSAIALSPPSATRAVSSMDMPRRSDLGPRPASAARSVSSSATASRANFRDDMAAVDIEDKGVYDTSSKQRVPSWCDRILFKSTVPMSSSPTEIIPPSSVILEIPAPAPPPHRSSRSKMGSILQALNPRSRTGSSPTTGTKHSTSTGSTEVVPASLGPSKAGSQSHGRPAPLRVVTTLGREEDSPIEISNSSGISPPSGSVPIVVKAGGAEMGRASTAPDMARTGSSASDRISTLRKQGNRRRSLSATLPQTRESFEPLGKNIPASASGPPTVPMVDLGDESHGTHATKTGPSGGKGLGLRRILSLLPGNLGHSHTPPAATPNTTQTLITQGPPLKVYKRGEVRCLGYKTLSDREMRTLEARSDHRPVIGHYAVYI